MTQSPKSTVAIIGGGPAGLMAAEIIAGAGVAVTLFDRMPSIGRKLLMAGRGGLNLTHSEPQHRFPSRYGAAEGWIEQQLAAFPPRSLIDWCHGLDQPTFIGSSGRVFPTAMKASPLLRAWLRRLDALGVRIRTRTEWTGWSPAGELTFADGAVFRSDATLLALGGASWPRLGADGGWTALLPALVPGLGIAPLRPANCGFAVDWSNHLRERFAGTPLKGIALSFAGQRVRGEAMITAKGIEGGGVYALAAGLRDAIARDGSAELFIDLRPDSSAEHLAARLDRPRGALSLATFLRKQAGLSPVAIGLLQETMRAGRSGPLSGLIKALPVRLIAPFGLERAISTAGGLRLMELDDHLMLRRRPGLFAAGEMLDWEAPTGGYLLQACLASGVTAGQGVLRWLRQGQHSTQGAPATGALPPAESSR